MLRLMEKMMKNLGNMKKKSSRVADENMFGGDDQNRVELPILVHEVDDGRRHGRNGFKVLYSIVRAPLSILSCISYPHVNGVDGVWVSGEFARISEMNHLIVNEGMRYAILM